MNSAEAAWERFFPKLVAAANRKMGNAARRIADEEDVAVDVFHSLCKGAREGKFEQLNDRTDLWKLLVAMAGKKAVDQVRRQTAKKRGGADLRGESVVASADEMGQAAGFDQFDGSEPTPEFMALVEEQQTVLFAMLRNDTLRDIARLRIEGHTNTEISAVVGISVRSVERKLGVIRDTWSDELEG